MLPDLINGAFETFGGCALLLSVIRLHRDKQVRGVHWGNVGFFTAWGLWNLLYYPTLGQWASFAGGVFLVAVNAVWLGQIIYYQARENAA